jgi:hypothetical protein
MVGWRGAAWVESFLRVFEVELWRSDGTVFFLKMLGGLGGEGGRGGGGRCY